MFFFLLICFSVAQEEECSGDTIKVRMQMFSPHTHVRTHVSAVTTRDNPGVTIDVFMNCGIGKPNHVLTCDGTGGGKKCGRSLTTQNGFDNGVQVFAGDLDTCFAKQNHPECVVTLNAETGVRTASGSRLDAGAGTHSVDPFACDATKFKKVAVKCKFRCDGVQPSCPTKAGDAPLVNRRSLKCECVEDEGDDFSEVCKFRNPCQNKGKCTANGEVPECACLKGFSGRFCELKDADWQEWSSCTGICGPNGSRERKCTEAPRSNPGESCKQLEARTGPAVEACILPNDCPTTSDGKLNKPLPSNLGEGELEKRMSTLDVTLILVGVVFVFVALLILVRIFCFNTRDIESAVEARFKEPKAMSVSSRRVLEKELIREVKEEWKMESMMEKASSAESANTKSLTAPPSSMMPGSFGTRGSFAPVSRGMSRSFMPSPTAPNSSKMSPSSFKPSPMGSSKIPKSSFKPSTMGSSKMPQSGMPSTIAPSSKMSQSGMPSTIAPSSRMSQSGMPSTAAPFSRMSQSGMPSTVAPFSRMLESFGSTRAPSSRMPQPPTPSAPSPRMPQPMPSFAPSSRAPNFTGPSTIAPEPEFSPRTKLRNALASRSPLMPKYAGCSPSSTPPMPRKDASLANGYTGVKRKFNSEKRDSGYKRNSGYKKNKENSGHKENKKNSGHKENKRNSGHKGKGKGKRKNSDSTGRRGSGKRSSYKKNPPRK